MNPSCADCVQLQLNFQVHVWFLVLLFVDSYWFGRDRKFSAFFIWLIFAEVLVIDVDFLFVAL